MLRVAFCLPSALKRQLPEGEQEEFVMNRGIDPCLVLYPVSVWEKELQRIHSKNQYVARNRAFARKFLNGAARLTLDGNGRVQVPKRLLEYGGLKKELTVVASFDKVEIWDTAAYQDWLDQEEFDMERLSEEVMGDASED